MAERIKVLLLIPHLGGGGAEQVTSLLARGLSREKYDLHLGLITQSTPPEGTLPPWVAVHAFAAPRVRASAVSLLRLVWELKPNVILSGIAHLNFLVLLLRPFFPPQTRVLVRQNATVSAALNYGGLPWYTRFLYWLLYRHADRVICQSRAMAQDMAELDIASGRITVLPNPVDIGAIRAAQRGPSRWTGPGPHLLAIGRLSHEKGFDLLLEAFSSLRLQFPYADLLIAGAGAEDSALKAQCKALGLENVVVFAGHLAQPYACFPGATVFVLSSRHEGLPNALLEAVTGGLPVVAVPASGGIVDLLRNRPGAWLASEVSAQALADALRAALRLLHPELWQPAAARPGDRVPNRSAG